MKNEFVPYQEAIALKELGFDEDCFGWWCPLGEPLQPELIIQFTTKENIHPNWKISCLAPLYQQAFKWFRENHNIDAWVQPFVTEKSNGQVILPDESYSFWVFKDGELVHDMIDFFYFKDAQLACLQTIIKFLKN